MPIPYGAPLIRALVEHPSALPEPLLSVLADHVVGADAEALIERADLPAHLSRRVLDRHVTNETMAFALAGRHTRHLSGPALVDYLVEVADPSTPVGAIRNASERVANWLTPTQLVEVLHSSSLPAITMVAAQTAIAAPDRLAFILRAYALLPADVMDAQERVEEAVFDRLDAAVRELAMADQVLAERAILAAPYWLCLRGHMDSMSRLGDELTDRELNRLVRFTLDEHADALVSLPAGMRTVVTRWGRRVQPELLRRIVAHRGADAQTVTAACHALDGPRLDATINPNDRAGSSVSHLVAELAGTDEHAWLIALTAFSGHDQTWFPRVGDVVAVVRGVTRT